MIPRHFPKSALKAANIDPQEVLPTNYRGSIEAQTKIHCIIDDYRKWEPRFQEIAAGKAVLSIREYTRNPHKMKKRSNEEEIMRLGHADGIGLERLHITKINNSYEWSVGGDARVIVNPNELEENEGLFESIIFEPWLVKRNEDNRGPFAIIHLTPFRYLKP